MSSIVKTCSCGRHFTGPEWDALELVGSQLDGEGMIELRNCSCESTIAIEVSMGPGAWLQSAAVYLASARRDINESYPADALTELCRARERIEFAIKQLECCVTKRDAAQVQQLATAAE